MNKLKYVLMFAAGAAVGGCATWFGVKTYYEERTEHDIAEVKEYYAKMSDKRVSEVVVKELGLTKKDGIKDDLEPEIRKAYKKIVEEYMPSTDDKDLMEPGMFDDYLSALSAESKASEEATDEEDDELEDFDPLNPPPEDREPTVITEDEFCDDMSFEKQQITFYTLDDTLCDANDSIMDIDRTVGAGTLSDIEPSTDMVYVRNYSLGIDYEIEVVNKSYTQYVLGIDPADEGGFRQKTKRFDDDEE